jgi:response regulator RpfG family c-di-GMP phosphodiesterase
MTAHPPQERDITPIVEAATHKTHILCVDDEQGMLTVLSRQLLSHYHVVTAGSGHDGLEVLRQQPDIAVIVSDMRMPGMDGAEFLGRAKDIAPDAVRILLTGNVNVPLAAAAVNDGQLFRFLIKPCPLPDLMKAVAAATEQHRLVAAERHLLEKTLHGSIRAFGDILALANPVAFGRANRVKQRVSELATELNIQERWQVEVAAMMSQIGTVALPPDTAEKMYYGKPLTEEEQAMVDRMPGLTEQLLGNIPRLQVVRGILATYRRGSSALSYCTAPEVELVRRGAQLLLVAVDFDILEAEGNTPDVALDTMRGRTGLYDSKVLLAFDAMCRTGHQRHEIHEVMLWDLKVGMVLLDDVRLASGLLLAGRGYEVKASFIERARNFSMNTGNKPVRVAVPRASIPGASEAPLFPRQSRS